MLDITARSWLLSVTESIALPPQPSRRFDARHPKFDFLDRPLPRPFFLALLIAAAIIL
jgi:hypothetical protein